MDVATPPSTALSRMDRAGPLLLEALNSVPISIPLHVTLTRFLPVEEIFLSLTVTQRQTASRHLAK